MCAIIDANRRDEVFGRGSSPEAAIKFLNWLGQQRKLVVGGKLREELAKSGAFSQWYRQAINAGWITTIDDSAVNERTEALKKAKSCRSDDEHIIALAQLSKARLLYSNDTNLQYDFGNPRLINNPRGKVYSTRINKEFGESHQKLLSNRNLCRN